MYLGKRSCHLKDLYKVDSASCWGAAYRLDDDVDAVKVMIRFIYKKEYDSSEKQRAANISNSVQDKGNI